MSMFYWIFIYLFFSIILPARWYSNFELHITELWLLHYFLWEV